MESLKGGIQAKYGEISIAAVNAGVTIVAGNRMKIIADAAGFGHLVAELYELEGDLTILGEEFAELEREAKNLKSKLKRKEREEAALIELLERCEEKRDRKNPPDEDKEIPPEGRPMV